MTLGKKIKLVIEENNLNQRQFAHSIDVNLSQLNMVLNEKRTISYEMLSRFLEQFPEVDRNWLFDSSNNAPYTPLQKEVVQYKISSQTSKSLDILEKEIRSLKSLLTQK